MTRPRRSACVLLRCWLAQSGALRFCCYTGIPCPEEYLEGEDANGDLANRSRRAKPSDFRFVCRALMKATPPVFQGSTVMELADSGLRT